MVEEQTDGARSCEEAKSTAADTSIRDSDGEFLLIEAAHELPGWVSPDNAENRVSLRAEDARTRGACGRYLLWSLAPS